MSSVSLNVWQVAKYATCTHPSAIFFHINIVIIESRVTTAHNWREGGGG